MAALVILFAALDAAQTLLAPVVAAIVTGVMLGPFNDALERRGLPTAVAATVVLLCIGLALVALLVSLGPTISNAVANAPAIWAEMRDLTDLVRGAVTGVQELQDQVSDALVTEQGAPGEETAEQMPVPSLLGALSYGPSLLAGALLFVATLYFFLSTRLSSYRGIARVFPGLCPDVLLSAEQRVSRYFLSITIVNAGLGALTALVMSLIGLPQPIMWGLAAFLLNFVLYLGPACVALGLLVAGLVTFEGAMSFLPVAAFMFLNMMEAQFATPTFVGRQMSLNPLLVFLSLAGWLWLWGPIGGLIAIPVLVWMLFVFSSAYRDAAAPDPTSDPAPRGDANDTRA
jgi:predicted PurR-regulated permease PerM